MDEAFRRPATTEEQTEGLGLFAEAEFQAQYGHSSSDVAPDIQSPAPSAPGSQSSEDAADCVSNPMRQENHRLIMAALAGARLPLSMHTISVKTGIPINVVCARLPELRPLWIQRLEGACRSHAKPSLRVDGFTLTDVGRARINPEDRR